MKYQSLRLNYSRINLYKRSLMVLLEVVLGIALSQSAFAAAKVLIILSSSNFLQMSNGHKHPTGYFLSELSGPAIALSKAGYELVFANPKGNAPVMDKISDDPKWFTSPAVYQEAKDFVVNNKNLHKPVPLKSLSDEKLMGFAAVFVPGGHAPMEDLVNKQVGRILTHFHKQQKPTALICHGPVALLSTRDSNGKSIYSGYNATSFSNAEEKEEEKLGVFGGNVRFYLQDALAKAGLNVAVGSPWTSQVIQDRELITGQNPMSEDAFTKGLLQMLKTKAL
jgi:putative intracellular protease/amidase